MVGKLKKTTIKSINNKIDVPEEHLIFVDDLGDKIMKQQTSIEE